MEGTLARRAYVNEKQASASRLHADELRTRLSTYAPYPADIHLRTLQVYINDPLPHLRWKKVRVSWNAADATQFFCWPFPGPSGM